MTRIGRRKNKKMPIVLTKKQKQNIWNYLDLLNPPCKGCSHKFQNYEECARCLFFISEMIYISLKKEPLHISKLFETVKELGCVISMELLDRHLDFRESSNVIEIQDNVYRAIPIKG